MPIPPNDLRLVPRMPGISIGPLHLQAEPSFSFIAEVADISILGIGLIWDLAFAEGSLFRVKAGPTGRMLKDELTAELRHATQQPDGRWRLGCQFSRLLTVADMETLAGPFIDCDSHV